MASQEQQKLQELSDAYTKLQQDLQITVSARQKLESQQTENLSVQKEFKLLAEDSGIYKMVGPVLLKQERMEADQAVEGRLQFVGREIKRIEAQIKDMQQESEKRKMEVFQLQSKMPEAGS